MAKNDTKVTDNPKLKELKLSDGKISLYLLFYMGYTKVVDKKTGKETIKTERQKEFLKLYLWDTPRTVEQRRENKETYELAKNIRAEREQQLKAGSLGYRLKSKNINFFDFLQAYYNSYTKGDIRMIKAAQTRFTNFIALKHPLYKNYIRPNQITSDMMKQFVEYLQQTSKGEGAPTHWKRWKKIIKAAVAQNVLMTNPCEDIRCASDEGALQKDILSLEEIETLINTTYPEQNQHARRAFIFTLYTGIRFCDINLLRYSNIDFANKLLQFNQKKTQGHSSKSHVVIPLNKGLLSLLEEQPKDKNGQLIDALLFPLPSNEACQKMLHYWTKKAGINKHITWHCARHSFAVNILSKGANIKTVASLLGHSGLKHTEKYTRAVDELKEAAINSLPTLKF